MDKYFKIKVKQRTQSQWLIWLMIVVTFSLATSIQFLHFPTVIKYSLDLLWVFLILIMIKNRWTFANKEMIFLYGWIGTFLIITLINYFFNYQSVFYYLWGLRNNFRFYIIFFACAFFMKKDDTGLVFKLFDIVFWINSIICFVQYFVFEIKQDNLGGVFGVEEGCNGALNLFLVIVIIKSMIFFLNKEETIIECLLKCASALIISAFAELKFFYIEFAIIVIMAVLITKFTFRKFLVIIGGVLGLVVSISLLIDIFPIFEDFFTIEAILDSATDVSGYTASGDMNRLTGMAIINERFLKGFGEKLFGLGLGNCDYSSYEFLSSPFFEKYSELHYTWMSTTWGYLENGLIGVVFFFGFFVIIAILMLKRILKKDTDVKLVQIVLILCVCCVLIGIYNASLRTETAYLVYFILSIPFWSNRNMTKKREMKVEKYDT